MDLSKYIGFKLEDIKNLIDTENVNYKVVEVMDPKGTKVGNDLRIINIVEKEITIIYVAYF